VIYFIQCGDGGPIKIGRAQNAWLRLGELQAANPYPLALIGARNGDRKAESAYHARFSAHKIRGEWFSPVREILAEAALFPPAPHSRARAGRPTTINTRVSIPKEFNAA
jgi:hypothetical protein